MPRDCLIRTARRPISNPHPPFHFRRFDSGVDDPHFLVAGVKIGIGDRELPPDEKSWDFPGEDLGQTGVVESEDFMESSLLIRPALSHRAVVVRMNT